MKALKKYHWLILVIVAGVCFTVACTKDKTPKPTTPPEPTKWEKIAGHYKVYDTNGVYLYDMDLIHKTGVSYFGNIQDSLIFQNFDNEFTFTSVQYTPPPINLLMGIQIGGGDTLYDSNNKRWKLYGPSYLEKYNIFTNDTINFRFNKTNINYWIQDATPYFSCNCKQIAVKQH